jgi:hypothetical protein
MHGSMKMKFILALLYCFISTGVALKGECERLSAGEKDVWLKGESLPLSFPMQLLAVFSFVPVSFVFRANLVAGNMYSTLKSNSTDSKPKQLAVPFSDFFNLDHFQLYWAQHKFEVTSLVVYQECYGKKKAGKKHGIIKIKRPEGALRSYKRSEFQQIVQTNKLKFPFANHQLLLLEGKNKFVGLYSFWDHLSMLGYVYQSLKPAPLVDRFSKAIMNIISRNSISINVIIDEHAFPSSILKAKEPQTHPSFVKIIEYVKNSACMKTLDWNFFIDPPPLYLMITGSVITTIEKNKLKLIVKELSSTGFLNIHTAKRIYEKYTKIPSLKNNKNKNNKNVTSSSLPSSKSAKKALSSSSSFKSLYHEDVGLYRDLSPEQLQYADLLISQYSMCFVPSQTASISSYLVQRFMTLEKKKEEKFESINKTTYGSSALYRTYGL